MKAVTWVLRVLSFVMFLIMAYTVYSFLSGYWDWDAPYIFIVTVFRLLSFVVFFVAVLIVNGLAAIFTGGQSLNSLLSGLYNTLILRMWYLQPYAISNPVTDVNEVFISFVGNVISMAFQVYESAFTFLYFLFAALGIAFFLQSLVRMEHKYVGGAFLSIQAILIVAAFRELSFYENLVFETDFILFVTSPLQILVLVSFAYLEISYQMIYSDSVGKPVEEREDTLKKQLLALRTATRKQDAIERGEAVSHSAMSRTTGATAFSFLREAIERKVVGSKSALENLDAVSDVRRLQIFVDELLDGDPNAKNELTARAAAPSKGYVVLSTVMGSAIRFLAVIALSFLLMSPNIFVQLLSLPPGIENSVELLQPEIVLLFLVPTTLTFVFLAMIISWITKREEAIRLSGEEEKTLKEKSEGEIKRKREEAAKARRAREKARKKGREDGEDEWDRALEETYKR
ncbi:hypothetical protein EU538_11155 [Candidatus Thorarchaeota archaeon]|nr:MAG: hypothetical protein EU538_11155 [Candidatus Thorarchaeota archaeon]